VYQHYRVKTVRREVVRQVHDYFHGCLLDALWKPRVSAPRNQRSRDVAEIARNQAKISQVLATELSYAQNREVVGWTAVGVGSQWKKLPVRIA
jgi:hypothetical protein